MGQTTRFQLPNSICALRRMRDAIGPKRVPANEYPYPYPSECVCVRVSACEWGFECARRRRRLTPEVLNVKVALRALPYTDAALPT